MKPRVIAARPRIASNRCAASFCPSATKERSEWVEANAQMTAGRRPQTPHRAAPARRLGALRRE